jgi:hypothetical protein
MAEDIMNEKQEIRAWALLIAAQMLGPKHLHEIKGNGRFDRIEGREDVFNLYLPLADLIEQNIQKDRKPEN